MGDEIAIQCIRLGVSEYLLREKLAKLPAVLSKLANNPMPEPQSTQTTLDLLKRQHKYIKQLEAEKQVLQKKYGDKEINVITGEIIDVSNASN